jgi:2-haloacid dehalogenase
MGALTMKYDLVLMDVDDTIFDFDISQKSCFQKAMQSGGHPHDDYQLGLFVEANHVVWSAFEQGKCTKDEALLERFRILLGKNCDAESLNKEFLKHLSGPPVYLDGAKELVDYCNQNSHLEFVTNADSKTQNLRFERSIFKDLQQRLTISDDVGVGKPNPKIFLHALEKSGFTTESSIVMIGDNLRADIGGAQKLGFDTIWVNADNSPNETNIIPTHIAQNPVEVLQHLQNG